MADEPIHDCLAHMDSYEETLGKELARTRGILMAALSSLGCATKKALQDRAVMATLKILEDERRRIESA